MRKKNDDFGRSYVMFKGRPTSITIAFVERYEKENGYRSAEWLMDEIIQKVTDVSIVPSTHGNGLVLSYNTDAIEKVFGQRYHLEVLLRNQKHSTGRKRPTVTLFSDEELLLEKVAEDIEDGEPIPHMQNERFCRKKYPMS